MCKPTDLVGSQASTVRTARRWLDARFPPVFIGVYFNAKLFRFAFCAAGGCGRTFPLRLVRGWCSSARLRWASCFDGGSSFLGRRTPRCVCLTTGDIIQVFYLGLALPRCLPWLRWDHEYCQEEDCCPRWRPGLSAAAFGSLGFCRGFTGVLYVEVKKPSSRCRLLQSGGLPRLAWLVTQWLRGR